ncbi:DUF2298 domain-containing protein [Motilimonas cestriensis]|uniref:DUF2298 domain-containing protein n=1 Tax=Motilimonas cestriensis TaxID=2742685 RepID=A0ABS8WFT3_9GAMM|nr:DUF2298 domain-containing protein [Motilimonas cestriensis]MCE2596210.1 DUF2298 domain-containing protein [Motilimonas cestriensis]
MSLIFLAMTLLILCTNLAAVGVVGQRYLGNYAVSKFASTLLFCLILFFIEHYIGLGQLHWLWPLTTLTSVWLLYQQRQRFFQILWKHEVVFVLGLLYGLLWKMAFPDIDGGSEALTDLSFVSNYYSGAQLPPPDNWLPGYTFNFYYGFQHYAAALLGRVLNLSVGHTYNLASAVMMAFMFSLVWSIVSTWCRNKYLKIVLLLAVVAGGTGVSPFVSYLYDYPENQPTYTAQSKLWASVRYIGMYDARMNTEFAKETLGVAPDTNLELPLETIGYLTFQGDYHPPLGSFALLLLALACIFQLERINTRLFQQRILTAILVATGPLMLITNTWVVPLQALLVFGWLIYRQVSGRSLCYKSVLIGGLVPLILSYPFLFEFTSQALSTPIKWVGEGQHVDFKQWLLVLWPLLCLWCLAAFMVRKFPIVAFIMVMSGLFLGLAELVIIDDPMGGVWERFNTSLKWWSWTQVFMLVALGSILFAKPSKWLRWVSLVPILALGSYSITMIEYFDAADKSSFGKLNGHHWLTKLPENRQMLQYLKDAPDGVVLEGLDRMAYTPASAMALFADKPSFTGWPSHQKQWRSNSDFIYQRGRDAQLLFEGKLDNSLDWLAKHKIEYIVYRQSDFDRNKQGWLLIQQQIARDYVWLPFKEYGDLRLGIWQRKEQGSH